MGEEEPLEALGRCAAPAIGKLQGRVEIPHGALHDGLEERGLGPEVVGHSAQVRPGRSRDLPHRGTVEPACREGLLGGVEQRIAGGWFIHTFVS